MRARIHYQFRTMQTGNVMYNLFADPLLKTRIFRGVGRLFIKLLGQYILIYICFNYCERRAFITRAAKMNRCETRHSIQKKKWQYRG